MYKHQRCASKSDNLTGHLFEYEVLGVAAKFVTREDIKYIPYRQALQQAKQKQVKEWDPTDPPTSVANDLHAMVALKLGIDNWSELKLFSSIGQALDRFHGVDAFFEHRGNVCTIDLTLKDKGGYKADMEVTPRDLEKDAMRCLAGDIARRLKGGVDVVRM